MASKSLKNNTKKEKKGVISTQDMLKWAFAVTLLGGGVVVQSMYHEATLPMKLVGWLAVLAMAVAVVWQTPQAQEAIKFCKEAQFELRKVVWPSREETLQMTGVIAIVVVLMAILLWVLDAGLMWVIHTATH